MDNFVLQGDPGIEGPIGRPGPKVWMIAIAVQIISFSDFKFWNCIFSCDLGNHWAERGQGER